MIIFFFSNYTVQHNVVVSKYLRYLRLIFVYYAQFMSFQYLYLVPKYYCPRRKKPR